MTPRGRTAARLRARGSVGRAAGTLVLALALLADALASLPALAAMPSVDGSLRYELFGYPDGDRRWRATESFVEGQLRVRGALTSALRYRLEVRAVADDAHFTAGVVDPRMQERRRPYVTVPEAVLDWTPRSELRVSIGRQIINWSGIDELQPANLMTPLDESDIFRRVQLGAFAVTTHVELPSLTVDLAVVPVAFQLTRIPQGRWRFVPDGIGQEQDVPPVQLDETQAGIRIGTRVGALDVALLGYVGRDMFPLFTLDPTAPLDDLVVTARNPHTRAGGFTMSLPLGESWLLRSEVLYYSSPDRDRDQFFQYVPLGVEYTLGDLRVVLNYLRFDRTSRGRGAVSQGERRFYPSFLFGETIWDAGGPLRARLRGGYDFQEGFALIEPEVSYRIWRELRIGFVAAVILAQASDGFDYFDQIRHEDRLGLRVQYFL